MFWELNKLLSLPKYENVENIFVGAFLTHQCAMMMRCQTQNLPGFLRYFKWKCPKIASGSTTFVTWRDRKLNTWRKPEVQQGVNL